MVNQTKEFSLFYFIIFNLLKLRNINFIYKKSNEKKSSDIINLMLYWLVFVNSNKMKKLARREKKMNVKQNKNVFFCRLTVRHC